jgi:hypothetical protein
MFCRVATSIHSTRYLRHVGLATRLAESFPLLARCQHPALVERLVKPRPLPFKPREPEVVHQAEVLGDVRNSYGN